MILSPFCEILAGTSFDFSREQKDILLNLITQGFRSLPTIKIFNW